MLSCEGYKMFKGTMRVDCQNGTAPFALEGTWLYKPEDGYWYVTPNKMFPFGTSFRKDMVMVLRDVTQ